MKAVVYDRYGPPDVLHVAEVEKPVPQDNEILIRTHATTVTSGDRRVRSLDTPPGFGLLMRLAFGIRRPRQRILGTELSGTVEAVGSQVRRYTVGDEVFAFGDAGMGCYAEYRCIREDGAVAHRPANLSFEEAAALSFGGTTALHFLQRARVQPGEKVLINGASGGVGTAALQLARHLGAEVTGVCSAANAELVQSLGADRVIDYRSEDFTASRERYDIILDTTGALNYGRCEKSLADGGRLLLIAAGLPDMLPMTWLWIRSSRKVIAGPSSGSHESVRFLADLAEAGSFRPFIDRVFPFTEMAEAHRYVDTGRKRGNVAITF